MKEITGFMPF